jgi:hypothetical protein
LTSGRSDLWFSQTFPEQASPQTSGDHYQN